MRLFILFFTLFFINKVTTAQVFFKDKADVLGLNVITGDTFLGSGVSFCDFDNDGWDDLTFATDSGSAIKFYKNVNGFFVEQAIQIPIYNFQTKQINWVDFDNDGDKDLFVTSNTDGNRLFENTGNLIFIDITLSAGLPLTNLETYGASWGDYDNDGYLDVFLSNRSYVVSNVLYRNNGDGTFSDVSLLSGIDSVGQLSFCSAFFDYNNDGYQDIYVSNDKPQNVNVLYKNNGNGTFTNVSEISGTNIGIDAMTVTVGDYNSDGWFDMYITNGPGGNVFFRNNGDGTFTNIAVVTGTLFNSIAWGAVFFDAENDQDIDLYVSGMLDGSNPNLISAAFYENLGSDQFQSPNAGFSGDNRESYSNSIGDFNNDGLFDIVVSNSNDENVFLWENKTITTNNWLKIKLEGTVSNKDGIGSVIEISINGEKQYRYTHCGEGYLSQNSGTEIFGLGNNLVVDYVKITWLSGIEDMILNVNANQLITITEGNYELSISDHVFEGFKFYPNPIKDSLVLESKNNIESVAIYNTLGQIVLSKKPNNNISSINLSKLQDGVYFVKVTIDAIVNTFRVLKN